MRQGPVGEARGGARRLLTTASYPALNGEEGRVGVLYAAVTEPDGSLLLLAGLVAHDTDASVPAPLPVALELESDRLDGVRPHTIAMNDQGDKLLVASEHGVWVVEVPGLAVAKAAYLAPAGASSPGGSARVVCSCIVSVGAGRFGASNPVRCAKWHPHAPEHVAVLSDVALALFDVTASLAEPTVSVSLRGAVNAESHAVAVAFGEPRSAFEVVSAFVLLSSGSVFCLCPLVPPGMLVHRHVVEAARQDLQASGLGDDEAMAELVWLDALTGSDARGPGGAASRSEPDLFELREAGTSGAREPRPQGPVHTELSRLAGCRATDIAIVPSHACPSTSFVVAGVDVQSACVVAAAAVTMEPVLRRTRARGAIGIATRPIPFGLKGGSEAVSAWEHLPAFERRAGGGDAAGRAAVAGPVLAAGTAPHLAGRGAALAILPDPTVSTSRSGVGLGTSVLLAWGAGAAVVPMLWPDVLLAASTGARRPAGSSLAQPFGSLDDAAAVAGAAKSCTVVLADGEGVLGAVPSPVGAPSALLSEVVVLTAALPSRRAEPRAYVVPSLVLAGRALRDLELTEGPPPGKAVAELRKKLDDLEAEHVTAAGGVLGRMAGGGLASAAAWALGLEVAEYRGLMGGAPDVEALLAEAGKADVAVAPALSAMFDVSDGFSERVKGVVAERGIVVARLRRLVTETEVLAKRSALVQAAIEGEEELLAGEGGQSLLDQLEECHRVSMEQQGRAEQAAAAAAALAEDLGPEERALHAAVGEAEARAASLAARVQEARAAMNEDAKRAAEKRRAARGAREPAGARFLPHRSRPPAPAALQSPLARSSARSGRSTLKRVVRARVSARELSGAAGRAAPAPAPSAVTPAEAAAAAERGILLRKRAEELRRRIEESYDAAEHLVDRAELERLDGGTSAGPAAAAVDVAVESLARSMRARLALSAGPGTGASPWKQRAAPGSTPRRRHRHAAASPSPMGSLRGRASLGVSWLRHAQSSAGQDDGAGGAVTPGTRSLQEDEDEEEERYEAGGGAAEGKQGYQADESGLSAGGGDGTAPAWGPGAAVRSAVRPFSPFSQTPAAAMPSETPAAEAGWGGAGGQTAAATPAAWAVAPSHAATPDPFHGAQTPATGLVGRTPLIADELASSKLPSPDVPAAHDLRVNEAEEEDDEEAWGGAETPPSGVGGAAPAQSRV